MEKQINEDSMQPVINPEKIIQWAGLLTAILKSKQLGLLEKQKFTTRNIAALFGCVH